MQINYKTLGGGLALLTLILIVWQHFGMARVLRIDQSWPYLEALDDQAAGGTSEATLSLVDDGILLECQRTLDYEHGFCELAIFTENYGWPGFDLRHYQTMALAADYTSPGTGRLRVTLRNFNAAYSIHGDISTEQVNEIEYDPARNPVLEVPLTHFQLASWWRSENPVPVEHMAPQFNNVTQINLTTGGKPIPGYHAILLRSLEFRGKWIEAVALYRVLLLSWLAFAVLALIWELSQYRRRLRASQERQEELAAVNRFLELRSEKFEKLATHDALTGVLNRAGLRDSLLQYVREARSSKIALAAVFIDIDYFKSINDDYGHNLGDEILREFAQLIARHRRDNDLFARWGGEEFLILCPDTTSYAAQHLAEKLRVLLSQHPWPHGGSLSASFGVTQFRGGEDAADFLNRADKALYQAKAAGRNRVAVL